jgi:hypothetical protein
VSTNSIGRLGSNAFQDSTSLRTQADRALSVDARRMNVPEARSAASIEAQRLSFAEMLLRSQNTRSALSRYQVRPKSCNESRRDGPSMPPVLWL